MDVNYFDGKLIYLLKKLKFSLNRRSSLSLFRRIIRFIIIFLRQVIILWKNADLHP